MNTAPSVTFELKLIAGGTCTISLPPPVAASTCYVVFMQGGGARWLWPVVRMILEAGGRPVFDYRAVLRQLQIDEKNVAPDSVSDLLASEGYTFGIIANPASLRLDLDTVARKTLLFVGDPREMIAELRTASPGMSDQDFLKSPAVTSFERHCEAFADFCRNRKHVTRYCVEDAKGNLQGFIGHITRTIDLSIAPGRMSRIMGSAANGAHRAITAGFSDCFPADIRGDVEALFAATLACFGYVPETAPTDAFLGRWSEFSHAMSARLPQPAKALSQGRTAPAANGAVQPRLPIPDPNRLVEFDPELLWRLRPKARKETKILGRNVIVQTDQFGCRPVLNQPDVGDKTLAAYGCSWTFGEALPFDETFCSVLQAMMPHWRIENHGTGAYGTLQNLVQLRRNSQWSAPDYVTFCFIPDHLLRNVADISFRRIQMTNQTKGAPPRSYPRGALDDDGQLRFRYVEHPRWDLDGLDLSDFSHDAHYLDLVTAQIFEQAACIAAQTGAHFFITTLRGDFSPYLCGRVAAAGIPIVNASIEGAEYTCLPDDAHPNTAANRIFAERIDAYLAAREAAIAAEAAGAPRA